jgi:hypothetical protein
MPSIWGLAAKIGLKLGEHAKHLEEGSTGRRRRVDRLLGRLERGAFGLKLADDVGEV